MKKISLLIALCMILTIGGVYATWTYTQSTDIADESVNMSLNLTNVTFVGTYGTYEIDQSGLKMTIDPKPGTAHTTALTIDGDLVIKFTPNTYAPEEIKEGAISSTYAFSLSNASWTYAGKNIVTLNHTEKHNITWTPQSDGTFTFTLTAADLANHISLTELSLDTKTEYDAYNSVLGQGAIVLTVSDGVSSGT